MGKQTDDSPVKRDYCVKKKSRERQEIEVDDDLSKHSVFLSERFSSKDDWRTEIYKGDGNFMWYHP